MSEPKITYKDLKHYGKDVFKRYNVAPKQGEQIIRKEMQGASQKELKQFYSEFYRKENK